MYPRKIPCKSSRIREVLEQVAGWVPAALLSAKTLVKKKLCLGGSNVSAFTALVEDSSFLYPGFVWHRSGGDAGHLPCCKERKKVSEGAAERQFTTWPWAAEHRLLCHLWWEGRLLLFLAVMGGGFGCQFYGLKAGKITGSFTERGHVMDALAALVSERFAARPVLLSVCQMHLTTEGEAGAGWLFRSQGTI